MSSLVWLRQDLRLSDNPALFEAASKGEIALVYILDDETPGAWKMGGASRWWLHYSLAALQHDLQAHGISLILKRGKALPVLDKLVQELKVTSLYWNRCYEPYAIQRDQEIKAHFKEKGLEVKSFKASLLIEPFEVQTKTGGYYKVYTPFWKEILRRGISQRPLAKPIEMIPLSEKPASDRLEDLALLPIRPNWAAGFSEIWRCGEKAAHEKCLQFLNEQLDDYARGRDFPSKVATSLLSPHLHFGEISPLQIWYICAAFCDLHEKSMSEVNMARFLSELGWREFAHHLLYHDPQLPDRPMKEAFAKFQWDQNDDFLKAWQKGQTGFPIVDAGMRELWQTGYMHNRVRMIVASFLTKDLFIPWQVGEKWFWDTLVDADLANNSVSWQWVAGCGADAAPYFRIFNPVLQSKKFDVAGTYIRKWVPELKEMPDRYIHAPSEAPSLVLQGAGVRLGENYPLPIVNHDVQRQKALERYRLSHA